MTTTGTTTGTTFEGRRDDGPAHPAGAAADPRCGADRRRRDLGRRAAGDRRDDAGRRRRGRGRAAGDGRPGRARRGRPGRRGAAGGDRAGRRPAVRAAAAGVHAGRAGRSGVRDLAAHRRLRQADGELDVLPDVPGALRRGLTGGVLRATCSLVRVVRGHADGVVRAAHPPPTTRADPGRDDVRGDQPARVDAVH